MGEVRMLRGIIKNPQGLLHEIASHENLEHVLVVSYYKNGSVMSSWDGGISNADFTYGLKCLELDIHDVVMRKSMSPNDIRSD